MLRSPRGLSLKSRNTQIDSSNIKRNCDQKLAAFEKKAPTDTRGVDRGPNQTSNALRGMPQDLQQAACPVARAASAFSLQQSFAFITSSDVPLPQSSPHPHAAQLHAGQLQLVQDPSMQLQSRHLQSLPQQHTATGALSALTANVGIVKNAATAIMASAPKIFENVNIALSSLRIESALGRQNKAQHKCDTE